MLGKPSSWILMDEWSKRHRRQLHIFKCLCSVLIQHPLLMMIVLIERLGGAVVDPPSILSICGSLFMQMCTFTGVSWPDMTLATGNI